MTASDTLQELAILRQLIANRFLVELEDEIFASLEEIEEELVEWIDDVRPQEMVGNRLREEAQEGSSLILLPVFGFKGFEQQEIDVLLAALAAAGVAAQRPDFDPRSVLVQGATLQDWFKRINNDARFNFVRQVRQTVINGGGVDELRLVASATTKRMAKDATSVMRTALNTVTNAARLAVFQKNANVITGVVWVSVLDSRTSLHCVARAGRAWLFPDYRPLNHDLQWSGPPPAHWNCRSLLTAMVNNQVPEGLSFDEFLRRKGRDFADDVLGKGRAELWQNGTITLNQLLDQRGNPLTLAELNKKYGMI